MQLSEQSSGVLADSTVAPESPGSSVALLTTGSAGVSGRSTSDGSPSEAVTTGSGSLGAAAGVRAGASATDIVAGMTLAAADTIGGVATGGLLSANLASAVRRGA